MWKLTAHSEPIDLASDSEMDNNVAEHSSKPLDKKPRESVAHIKHESTDHQRLRVKTTPKTDRAAKKVKESTLSLKNKNVTEHSSKALEKKDRIKTVAHVEHESTDHERLRVKTTPKTDRPAKRVKEPEPTVPVNAWLQAKWAPHEGHGSCRGLDMPCVMGIRGAAAPAGPSGLCDLCNLDDIVLLHQEGEGRLTHLLLQLASTEADLALARIAEVDADVAEDLRPERLPPGVRGDYKGYGSCRGVQDVCGMGVDGLPAAAGPDGLCDLCNINKVASLHQNGNGRLTHLLLQLTEAQADIALDRIKHKDEAVAKELRLRMTRARQRKNPNRPRRGPRKAEGN
ncbi:UBP23 [Symbiodinium sp. CCMP2456]|nr:UBP23 [Symbiodinium sp. CCMP2456]